MSSHAPERRCCFGLFNRRERWGISLRGWLLLLVLLVGGGVGFLRFAHPFLAVTDGEGGDYLVVEGWISVESLKTAVKVFEAGKYRGLITSGGVARAEWKDSPKATHAEWAMVRLARLGFPTNRVVAVPCENEVKDRTYHSALAVRRWLGAQGGKVDAITVVTQGAHARRTWLMYQKAFGPAVRVGVVAAVDKEYDPNRWWGSSEGVRVVVGEALAYLYARLLFTAD